MSESERNSASGVRTRLLRSLARKSLHQEDTLNINEEINISSVSMDLSVLTHLTVSMHLSLLSKQYEMNSYLLEYLQIHFWVDICILFIQKHILFLVHLSMERTLAQRLECSPMARETWVQSQVESYQRL